MFSVHHTKKQYQLAPCKFTYKYIHCMNLTIYSLVSEIFFFQNNILQKREKKIKEKRKSLGYRGCVSFIEHEHQHLEDNAYMHICNDPPATKKITCLDNKKKYNRYICVDHNLYDMYSICTHFMAIMKIRGVKM